MRRSSSKSGRGSPHISTRRETTRAPICSSSSCSSRLVVTTRDALRFVALVDQRVELLQYPLRPVLGAEIVDVEQVDGGEPLEELGVGLLAGLGVEGAADAGQELGKGVDCDRAPGLQGDPRDQHRQRRLAGAGAAVEPETAAGGRCSRRSTRSTRARGARRSRSSGSRAGGRRRRRGTSRGSPSRSRAAAPCATIRERHSQGRATSSGPRIQPEPSQMPSRQGWRSPEGERIATQPLANGKSRRRSATSSSGGPSPAGCSTGFSSRARSANFG